MVKNNIKTYGLRINLKVSLVLIIASALIAVSYYNTDIFNYLSKHQIYKQRITNKIDDKDLNNLSSFNFIQSQPHIAYDSDYKKNKFGIVSLWLKYESKVGFIKKGKDYQFSIFHTNVDCESKKTNIDFMVSYFTANLYPTLDYNNPNDDYSSNWEDLEFFCKNKD